MRVDLKAAEQGVLYLSEQAETLIKQDFLRDGCPNGSHTDTHTERSIGAVSFQKVLFYQRFSLLR